MLDQCKLPPKNWSCSRKPGHDGPCAASPVKREMLTTKERIVIFLIMTAHHGLLTASQIHNSLNTSDRPVKLSSLSSVLKKMYDAGEIERVDNVGPRGGYGYRNV